MYTGNCTEAFAGSTCTISCAAGYTGNVVTYTCDSSSSTWLPTAVPPAAALPDCKCMSIRLCSRAVHVAYQQLDQYLLAWRVSKSPGFRARML